MFGSLTMFAAGVRASSPSSASASSASPRAARMRPASEMSRSSTSAPALPANASTTGRKERVARAGASSVYVQWIFMRKWFVS